MPVKVQQRVDAANSQTASFRAEVGTQSSEHGGFATGEHDVSSGSFCVERHVRLLRGLRQWANPTRFWGLPGVQRHPRVELRGAHSRHQTRQNAHDPQQEHSAGEDCRIEGSGLKQKLRECTRD